MFTNFFKILKNLESLKVCEKFNEFYKKMWAKFAKTFLK